MTRLKPIEIDKSWIAEYDRYLQRFQTDLETSKQRFGVLTNDQPHIADAHSLMLANMFNVLKAKKVVQNIYKRPI